MSKTRKNYKIFVSNIPYSSGYEELHDLFSKFGPIRNCVLPSKKSSRGIRGPLGTAFVTFYDEASMKCSLSGDSNLALGGRDLRVEVAIPKASSKNVSTSLSLVESIPITPPNVKHGGNQHIVAVPFTVWMHTLEFLDLPSLCRLEETCRVFYWLCREYWHIKKSLSFRSVFSLWHFKSPVGLTSELLAIFLSRTGSALHTLDLSASSRFLTPGCLEVIAHYTPQLTTLDISGLQLSQEPVQKLFSICTGLRHLCLSGCNGLSEKILWWIIKARRDLISLNISESKRVTGNCLRMLSGSLQHFNASNCSRLSTQAVSSICSQSPDLLSLNLSRCYSLTPLILQEISTCSSLRSLHFPRTVMTQENMAPPTYLLGLTKINTLQYLDLSHQQLLSDSFLQTLASTATYLTTLKIPGCHKVTDTGISHLKDCHHLTTLDISYLHLVTDLGLLSLQLDLRSFAARMCLLITCIGISSIIENSSSLLQLDISSCAQVSAGCFPYLLAHLNEHKLSSTQSRHWAFGGTAVTPEEQQKFFEESGVKLTLIDSSNVSFAHCLNTEMYLPMPHDDGDPEIEREPLHLSTDPEVNSPLQADLDLVPTHIPVPDNGGFTITSEENWDDDCAPNYFFNQTNDSSLALADLTTAQLCLMGDNLDDDTNEADEINFLISDDVVYSQDMWEHS